MDKFIFDNNSFIYCNNLVINMLQSLVCSIQLKRLNMIELMLVN